MLTITEQAKESLSKPEWLKMRIQYNRAKMYTNTEPYEEVGEYISGTVIQILTEDDQVWHQFTITPNPFSNCQTAALASFDQFKYYLHNKYHPKTGYVSVTDEKEIRERVAKFINLVQASTDSCKKRQLIIDVHDTHCAFIDKYFPNQLVKSSYINSTNKPMTIYLLKLW